jgi:hypothetical protein
MNSFHIPHNELASLKEKAALTGAYQFLDVRFSVSSDDEAIVFLFDQMYQRFKIHPDDVEHQFYVVTSNNRFNTPLVIFRDQAYPIFANEPMYNHAYMVIFRHIFNLFRDFYIIHAGVVSRGEDGIVLTGQSCFGKTTLTLEMVRKGYRFLSDEFCPIERGTMRISPFPRTISLSAESMAVLKNVPHEITAQKNDERGKKLFDIDAWKEGSIGQHAIGKHFFFVRGRKSKQEERTFYLLLMKEDHELIRDLKGISGISLISRNETEHYLIYRFTFRQGEGLINKFEETCQKYPQNIVHYEVTPYEEPYFDREPSIEEIPKSKAAIELMRNMLNRSQNALVMKNFKTSSQLLLNLGEVVSQAKCYDLFTGKLDQMAELITKTVEA